MVRMAQRLVVTLVLAMALVLPATAQTVPTPSPATKQRAKQHFLSGVERFDEGDYDGALAEFLASRKLFATPSATKNAAISYRLLRRYAAAVDLFETLLAEFPALGDADRKLAQRELLELAPRVGQIVISCSELDAQLSLDGRDRGSLDATKAIRVSIGSHTIRISKSGFEPYQTRVDVAGAQKSEVRVELEPLASSGVLSVSEALGRPFVVVIDGTAVGKTPWRGSFAPGNHTILLRGDDNMGTPPSQVEVRVDEVTSVSLAAKKLLAHLRVEPTPASAVVFVDGVNVGSGFFEGRLLGGEHRVRVEAPGFVPLSERVMIADNASETVVATLSADPTQSTRPAFDLGLDVAALVGPSIGGSVEDDCAEGCSASISAGVSVELRGSYQFASGFVFGASAGYLLVDQKIDGRAGNIDVVGSSTEVVKLNESRRLHGPTVGMAAGYRFRTSLPITLRLALGAIAGRVVDNRELLASSFLPSQFGQADWSGYFFARPELRVGYRVSDQVELSAGVGALVLVALAQPSWRGQDAQLLASTGELARFNDQTIVGRTILLITPGLGARYSF